MFGYFMIFMLGFSVGSMIGMLAVYFQSRRMLKAQADETIAMLDNIMPKGYGQR